MFAAVPARCAVATRPRAARGPPRRGVGRAPPPATTATSKKKDKRYPDEFTRSSEEDPLRSASPTSATFARDAVTGKPEMIFDVELPAIDMGITFREAGNTAVVESSNPEAPPRGPSNPETSSCAATPPSSRRATPRSPSADRAFPPSTTASRVSSVSARHSTPRWPRSTPPASSTRDTSTRKFESSSNAKCPRTPSAI